MEPPSLTRLNLLRGLYLLLAIGLSLQFWPLLLGPIAAEPVYESIISAILSALALVSFIGLIAPLKMLPVLLFEIAWKVIWLLSVALPRWSSGALSDEFSMQLFAIGMVAPFVIIFPWRFFFRSIISNPDHWRRTTGTT